MKKKLPLSIPEIIIYSVSGLFGLWALTYIALGISCEFISYKSALYIADEAMKGGTAGFGFLYQGFIILAVAVLLSVITLLVTAKKSDRDFEKAQRRAARLKKKPEVVDAEVAPVEEENKEE